MTTLTKQQLAHYLAKIGLASCPKPSLDTLAKLQRLHLLHFPFGVVDVHLKSRNPNKKAIPIDLDSIYHKLVVNGRDGYCFEQNELFYAVLKAVGFDNLQKYIGSVVFNRADKPPPNHEVLIMTLKGQQYLVDVGFAPRGSLQPVPLKIGHTVYDSQAKCSHRLILDEDKDFILQTQLQNKWVSLYAFNTKQPASQADLKKANRLTSVSNQTPFLSRLFVALNTLEGAIIIFWNKLIIKKKEGKAVTRSIKTPEGFRNALKKHLAIDLPNDNFDGKRVTFESYLPLRQLKTINQLETTLRNQKISDAQKVGPYQLRKRN